MAEAVTKKKSGYEYRRAKARKNDVTLANRTNSCVDDPIKNEKKEVLDQEKMYEVIKSRACKSNHYVLLSSFSTPTVSDPIETV